MARIEKVHNVTLTRLKGNTGRALVSVYGNVDTQGDRVMPGAFTNSIAEWEASGDPLPFIWSHMWSDPMAHIGRVTKFTDTAKGLVVDFEITDPTEFAAQVVRLLKERRVTQMSFAYDVLREITGTDGANELVELRLIECGPTLAGANSETDLLSVKAVQQMLAAEEQHTSDADLWKKFDALFPDADIRERLAKAAAPVSPVAVVLTTAAARLEQNAVRALSEGLVTEAEALMGYARELRAIAGGSGGDVQDTIDALVPIIAALRNGGATVAGDNLERTVFELQGGATNQVDNADRVEGSINTDVPKSYDRITAPIPETDSRMGVVRSPETLAEVGEPFQIPDVDDGPVRAEIVSHRRDA